MNHEEIRRNYALACVILGCVLIFIGFSFLTFTIGEENGASQAFQRELERDGYHNFFNSQMRDTIVVRVSTNAFMATLKTEFDLDCTIFRNRNLFYIQSSPFNMTFICTDGGS